MDKLVHDDKGVTTISNDGATIMKVRDETRSPRGVGTAADDARNAPIGKQVPTLPPCFPASEARARRVETVFAKKKDETNAQSETRSFRFRRLTAHAIAP